MSALQTVASAARRSVPTTAVPSLVRARTRRALRDADAMARESPGTPWGFTGADSPNPR